MTQGTRPLTEVTIQGKGIPAITLDVLCPSSEFGQAVTCFDGVVEKSGQLVHKKLFHQSARE